MQTTNLTNQINHLSPCREASDWLSTQPDVSTAWRECTRGDWMLWLLARTTDDRKQIVLAACQCARLSLKYTDDPRPLQCIITAEKWGNSDPTVTLDDVRRDRDAAHAAAAATAAAAYAAYATYAAAAAAAADAADAAADAAAAAATAATADAAARFEILQQCADIVRQYFPEPPTINK